jgi:subtilisin family serine protease
MKKYFFIFLIIVSFIYIFVSPSFAITGKELINRELPENYTAVLIQLPGVFHKPEAWNQAFGNVSVLSNLQSNLQSSRTIFKAYKIDNTKISSPDSAVTEFTSTEYSNINMSDDNRVSISATAVSPCLGTNKYPCNSLEPPNCYSESKCCSGGKFLCSKKPCSYITSQTTCESCGCTWSSNISRYANFKFAFNLSSIDIDKIAEIKICFESYYTGNSAIVKWKNQSSQNWIDIVNLTTNENVYCKNFNSSFNYLVSSNKIIEFGITGLASSGTTIIYVDSVSLTLNFKSDDLASSLENYNEITGKSFKEVASIFKGDVFFNEPEYSYAYVRLPNENYDNLTKAFKFLGYDVKNVSWGRAMLDESRSEIGLPYNNPSTGQPVTGNGVQIAILDTGIDPNHQDFFDANGNHPLNNKVTFWSDLIDGNPCCQDQDGHGTFVASIAAGTGANSNGKYKGIAPNAQLLIWRISRFDYATLGSLANAINGAVNQNVDVISVSFGWANENLLANYDTNLADACRGLGANDVTATFNAIQNAVNNGIFVVFAAGNEGPDSNTIAFPACINEVIAVGETFKRDYSSNYYSLSTGLDGSMSTSLIHVKADASGESLDKEWYAFNISGAARYYTWSGFIKVFSSSSPTINLNVEGQYKTKACLLGDQISWNPGSASKGDTFWSWQRTVIPYGGMEVFGKVHTNWGYCPLWVDVWGTTYINSFPCSGTPNSCNSFDPLDKNGCKNQEGCSWCGCWVWTFYPITGYCKDVSVAECLLYSPSEWRGCEGTAKTCGERLGGEWDCGTTSTTGCSGQWVLDDTIVRLFSTKRASLIGVPAPESSRGPTPNGLIKPDVTAPGVDVCAARASGTTLGDLDCGNDNYVRAGGTSAAAPVVAGFIALLKEIKPTATYNEILASTKFGDILVNYFGDVSENQRGYGRVNISKATDCITGRAYDSDGIDYQNQGTCIKYYINGVSCQKMHYTDTCTDSNTLTEYYVSGSSCVYTNKNCKDYGSDYICTLGTCLVGGGGGGGGGGNFLR